MESALVHWRNTPRLYINVFEKPKRAGMKGVTCISIDRKRSNKQLDDSHADYENRTGFSVVGMFPHTQPNRKEN